MTSNTDEGSGTATGTPAEFFTTTVRIELELKHQIEAIRTARKDATGTRPSFAAMIVEGLMLLAKSQGKGGAE